MCASIWYYLRLFLGIVFTFQGSCPFFAQIPSSPDFDFRRISMQDGLANQIITAICEDERGMLWFGTHGGLYFFDGFRATRFLDKSKGFLTNEYITDLEYLRVPSGSYLIVGTLGNGWLIETKTQRIVPFESVGLPEKVFRNCTQIEKQDAGGYIAMSDSTLYRVLKVGTNRYSADFIGTIPCSPNTKIVQDPSEPETFWLLPPVQAAYRVTIQGSYSKIPLPHIKNKPTPMPGLLGLVQTNKGLIGWDFVRNLYRYEPTNRKFEVVTDRTLASIFPAISALDRAYNQRNVLRMHQHLQAGQEAIGTTLGLFILRNRVKEFRVPAGMVGSEVRGILTDSLGNWWAGTYNGLFSGTLKSDTIKAVVKIAGVWAGIPMDKNHWMLACENPTGLFVLNLQNNTVRNPAVWFPASNLPESALTLCRDFRDNIWVGTYSYLYWATPKAPFDLQILTHPQSRAPVSAPFYRALLSDRDSNIWAGAENGLFRFNLREFPERWSVDTMLKDVIISDIYLDRDGFFWIATKGKGMARYSPHTHKFEWFDTEKGLANNATCRIESSDEDQVIWVSTHNGLSRLDVRTGIVHNYHEEDGIPGNEFNSGASARFTDGTLMFGGVSGLVQFHPDSLRPHDFKYKTFYSHIHVQPKRADSIEQINVPVGPLQLPAYPRLLEVCLGVNDYVQLVKTQFRYRLRGAFESWIYTNGENKIRFFNLAPGIYVLETQALPHDGHLGPPVLLSIIVAVPYYETWWFRALMLAGIILVAYFAYWYRLRQFLRTYAIRQQIADDLHDDIGNKLNITSILLQKIKRDFLDKNLIPSADIWASILETNQHSLQSLRTLIWSVDPHKDRLQNIFTRMQDFADDYLQPLNIACKFVFPDNVPDQETSLDFRHNVIMLFQELVTNMVKHAHPRQISVLLCISPANTLTITLTNTFKSAGEGHFSSSSDNRGMATLKRRLEKIGGSIKMMETADTFQTIVLSFPKIFTKP